MFLRRAGKITRNGSDPPGLRRGVACCLLVEAQKIGTILHFHEFYSETNIPSMHGESLLRRRDRERCNSLRFRHACVTVFTGQEKYAFAEK